MTLEEGYILIADDSITQREQLRLILEKAGYRVSAASNGKEAIALMEQEKPILVITDILMPEADGFAVLGHMKTSTELKQVPVIVISVVEEMDSVVRCIEKGADDYLTKPFSPPLLKARITTCLEKERLHERERVLHRNLAQSYEALRQAEEAHEALFHMIVHDLNNPLSTMLGAVQILLRNAKSDSPGNGKLLEHLQNMHDSGAEMSLLIRSILDVSKLETGNMPVFLSPVDAVGLLKRLCEQFAPQAETVSVHLSFKSGEDSAMVRADEELLARLLRNLLANALRYAWEGGSVKCGVKTDGNDVILSIEDDGPGIPPEYKDKVFDKYFQDTSRGRKGCGVGLGLTFCKMAADAQGAEIRVESGEGKGARFEVVVKSMDASTLSPEQLAAESSLPERQFHADTYRR